MATMSGRLRNENYDFQEPEAMADKCPRLNAHRRRARLFAGKLKPYRRRICIVMRGYLAQMAAFRNGKVGPWQQFD